MNHDCAEYGWEQLQQRLEQKFSRYLQNESETSECKQQAEEPFAQVLQSSPEK
jgi:hypothetical protein